MDRKSMKPSVGSKAGRLPVAGVVLLLYSFSLALVGAPTDTQAQSTTNLRPQQGSVGAVLEQKIRTRLRGIGITTCAETFVYVAAYLAGGQQANFTIEPIGGGLRPSVMTMESADPGFPSRQSSLIVGPNCDGMYSQTIRWKDACTDVKRLSFSSFREERVMLNEVLVSRGASGVQVSLLPIVNGCISIKTETFLR
jgi:hypothetical protein